MTADDTAGEAPGHTTERIDPSYYLSSRADAFLYACHLATYDFAATFTEGRRVLDFGCGTGYGTHRIAPGCERIVGVDVSDEAIGEATRRFQAPNLGYQRIAPAEEAPLPFDDDAQGLDLANDTRYGLAASAWTSSVFRAQRASAGIAAGCVWINDHIPIISEMPHGGYKASGFGKDMSTYSFEEYTQVKHVMSALSPQPHKSWHDIVFTSEADHHGSDSRIMTA